MAISEKSVKIWLVVFTTWHKYTYWCFQTTVWTIESICTRRVCQTLRAIRQELTNDDLGKSFYKRLTTVSPVRLIDFDNPQNNSRFISRLSLLARMVRTNSVQTLLCLSMACLFASLRWRSQTIMVEWWLRVNGWTLNVSQTESSVASSTLLNLWYSPTTWSMTRWEV